MGANFVYFFFLSMPFNIFGGCAHESLSPSLPLSVSAGRQAGLTCIPSFNRHCLTTHSMFVVPWVSYRLPSAWRIANRLQRVANHGRRLRWRCLLAPINAALRSVSGRNLCLRLRDAVHPLVCHWRPVRRLCRTVTAQQGGWQGRGNFCCLCTPVLLYRSGDWVSSLRCNSTSSADTSWTAAVVLSSIADWLAKSKTDSRLLFCHSCQCDVPGSFFCNYSAALNTDLDFDMSMSFLVIKVDWDNLSFPDIPQMNFVGAFSGQS